MSLPSLPPSVRRVEEVPASGPVPAVVHPEWRARHPWLIQGTTTRGGQAPFDLALFTAAPGGAVQERWQMLLEGAPCVGAAHARQVHGSGVRVHRHALPGLHLSPPCDGHATATPGLLLAVTVADCVPVTLVHPGRRIVATLHAGWRGVAAGILDVGLDTLLRAFDAPAREVEVHLGPAICGECYEVGPEVHRALGLAEPARNTPVDTRAVLARQAIAAGVPAEALTVSGLCTRCTEAPDGTRAFFSHRAGDPERQVGFAAVAAA